MAEVTVGIDIGTTAVKAVAAGNDGHVLRRCRMGHTVTAPDADTFDHDPAEAWRDGVLAAWREIAPGLDVAGVAVAAMVPSLCAVDEAGIPVSPGLLYGDGRGRDAAGEAVGFAAWLARRFPGARLWPAQAVANAALGHNAAIDTSTAMTMTPLFDGQGWDRAICAEIGISEGQLPDLVPGYAPIGEIDGSAISAGTIDALAEQIVAGAERPGDVLVICGTTLITWAVTREWVDVDGLWTVPYSTPGVVAIGGASNAGGLFLDHVRRLVGDHDIEAVDPEHVPVWLPYIRGERTPLHDPDRRSALLEFELGHGPADVLRAGYEAAGFVVRHHLDLAGTEAARIVAVGGGVASEPWMQSLADTTGLPVDVSAAGDGAALGAAYLGRVTAGLEPDTSAAGRWARTSHRVEPRPDWVEACERRYQRFRERTARP